MARIGKPNYTMLPNVLIESMGEMTESEFRIVIAVARKTFGWQKERDLISLSQLIALTGMSKQGVCNGIEKAIENGWLARIPQGQSFIYELLVNEVDQSEKPASQRSGQVQAKPLVNVVDTQKKEVLKEKGAPKNGARPDPVIDLLERTAKAQATGQDVLSQFPEHLQPLASAFMDAIHDRPGKRELVRWRSDLLGIYEGGYLPADIAPAVAHARRNGTSIKAPGSVLYALRDLRGNGAPALSVAVEEYS